MTDPAEAWTDDVLRETVQLVEQIGQLLAEKSPEVQGCALADLLATWLAGHVRKDMDETRRWRADLLARHIGAVTELVTINDEMWGRPPDADADCYA